MDLEPLFRAVYASPDDDTHKLVLADALQVEGDPRGDFIALQLRDSVIARRRCDKLLARNREAFLGALTRIVLNPKGARSLESPHEHWEKGFLVECTVRLEGEVDDLPELATVRRLHVFERPDAPIALASPHFRSLKSVVLYGTEHFATRARTVLANANRVLAVTHVRRPIEAI